MSCKWQNCCARPSGWHGRGREGERERERGACRDPEKPGKDWEQHLAKLPWHSKLQWNPLPLPMPRHLPLVQTHTAADGYLLSTTGTFWGETAPDKTKTTSIVSCQQGALPVLEGEKRLNDRR